MAIHKVSQASRKAGEEGEIDDVEAIVWTWTLPDGAPDLAQARQDIRTLLAVIERQRARIALLEEQNVDVGALARAMTARVDAFVPIVRAVANGTTPTRHANYLIFHETGPDGMVTGVELRKQARALLGEGDR